MIKQISKILNSDKLENSISYEFKNKNLLKEALTHRSYLNENPKWHLPHNERLEFLGDAVLELVVTEYLFEKFPKEPEGKLTALRAALVNYLMLAKIAKEIDLEKYILLSRGEARDFGRAREVILANAMESLLGAIYIDGEYGAAGKFIKRFIIAHLDEVLAENLYRDPKSLLQEKTQASLKITPSYRLLGEQGPDHKKIFIVGVYLENKELARGEGLSKQDAEVEAAEKALENFGN